MAIWLQVCIVDRFYVIFSRFSVFIAGLPDWLLLLLPLIAVVVVIIVIAIVVLVAVVDVVVAFYFI